MYVVFKNLFLNFKIVEIEYSVIEKKVEDLLILVWGIKKNFNYIFFLDLY